MRNRRLLSVLGAGALVFGLSLTAMNSAASEPANKKEPAKEHGKAKTGDACKTNSDCDQSSGRQACGDGKCRVEHIQPPT